MRLEGDGNDEVEEQETLAGSSHGVQWASFYMWSRAPWGPKKGPKKGAQRKGTIFIDGPSMIIVDGPSMNIIDGVHP